jgi:hypothetical protein
MSLADIGKQFGKSERWAGFAIAAAERRKKTLANGHTDLRFDGSVLALRKFTSSELLDAGFNISMVAERQGHGPQVLARHYARLVRRQTRKRQNISVGSSTVLASPTSAELYAPPWRKPAKDDAAKDDAAKDDAANHAADVCMSIS